jgi:hypothetical protein
VVLKAFLDESQQETGIYAVAGYVFRVEDCQPFEEDWNTALASAPTPVQQFHMNEYEDRRHGFTASWSQEERISLLQQLISIMCRHTQLLVIVALDLQAFNAQFDYEKELIYAKSPYVLCIQAVMVEIVKWMQNNKINQDVQYLVDNLGRHQGKTQMLEAFAYLTSSREIVERFQILGVDWTNSIKYVQLQAADILVYEAAKEAARKMGYSQRPKRKSLQFLRAQPRPTWRRERFIDAAELSRLRVEGAMWKFERAAHRPL